MADLEATLPDDPERAASDASADEIARRAPLGVGSKFLYGTGEMINGIATTALGYLAFFYMTAICGLSGTRAGTITFITLLVDSIADPAIGLLSDNTRSRLGRRHPYLLVSIVPLALSFGLVFSVPAHLSGVLLFVYFTLLLLVLRISMSLFYLPYLAIGAEISDDYHERSSIVAYRLFFRAISAFACLYIGLGGLHPHSAALLHRTNYSHFAWICAIALCAVSLTAALGTLREIPRLHQAQRRSGSPIAQLVRELREVFHNRAFVSLFLTCLIFFIAQGTAAALALDANTYFWHLTPDANRLVILVFLLAHILGLPIARFLQYRVEKRTFAIMGAAVFCLCQFYPPLLRIVGVIPEHFRYLTDLLVANSAVSGIGLVTCAIGLQSMIADAADYHEYLFGARREAMFLSGLTFSVKSASGLGSLIAGVALDSIRFPTGIAHRGLHPALSLATVRGLGWICGPLPATITALCVFTLFTYKITHAKFLAIKEALSERRRLSGRAVTKAP